MPAGSTVHFEMTSIDVLHGIHIWDTSINAMIIPGQITRVSQTFNQPGEYGVVCHEYCGIGHHQMFGRVVVTP